MFNRNRQTKATQPKQSYVTLLKAFGVEMSNYLRVDIKALAPYTNSEGEQISTEDNISEEAFVEMMRQVYRGERKLVVTLFEPRNAAKEFSLEGNLRITQDELNELEEGAAPPKAKKTTKASVPAKRRYADEMEDDEEEEEPAPKPAKAKKATPVRPVTKPLAVVADDEDVLEVDEDDIAY